MQVARIALTGVLSFGVAIACAPTPAAPTVSIRALGAGEHWLRSIPPSGL